ncbi:MAG: hypothetical protein ACI4ED_06830 [Suilimivivens sp.]
MGIDILSGFGRIQPYYKASDIPTVTPEEIRKQDAQQADVDQSAAEVNLTSPDTGVQEDNRSKIADLENISLTFNKEESFDYLGSESGLMNLDVQKAVSDMQKDSILQEYQYFVGTAASFMNTEDGLVFQKS